MRTVLILLAVVAVCLWQGLTREGGGSGGGTPHHTATPVLSVRRVPSAVGQLVAAERVAGQLTAIVAGLPSAQLCVDVRVAGTDVFAASPGATLVPASNVKLLTATAALLRLGPDTRLTTRVVAGGPGDPLYLVGGGDPLLATAGFRATQTDWTESAEPVTSLENLADRVRAAGITSVAGVVGDDSRYDAQRTVPTWKASYVTSGQIRPVSALEVNAGSKPDPAAAFAELLTARGIHVGAVRGHGVAPPSGKSVASIDSLRMSDLVGEMLRESDNLAAEMLTKELGVRFGAGGTWAAGVGVIGTTLSDAGIPMDGWVQVDGSGLDRTDRVSCHTLVALLTSSSSPAIAAALPTAGSCGTLVKRFVGTPAAGRVRAKTGSLTGVASLSGYVFPSVTDPTCPPSGAPPTEEVAFSLLVNGVNATAAASAIEDDVAVTVASYPQLPVLAPLEPLP